MAMHEINIDGAGQKIFHDCVDELEMGGKPKKVKKVGRSTVYMAYELEEDKEELEGRVLGYGGEYASIVPVVYPCGTVSVSSIGSFLSVGSSSKTSCPSFSVSIRALHIQEYFKNKMGMKRKLIKPPQ